MSPAAVSRLPPYPASCLAAMSSSSLGGSRYRLVGRLSSWHTGKRPSAASSSPSVIIRSPKAAAITPPSAAAVTSCRSCHSAARSTSCTRPASLTHTIASGGR